MRILPLRGRMTSVSGLWREGASYKDGLTYLCIAGSSFMARFAGWMVVWMLAGAAWAQMPEAPKPQAAEMFGDVIDSHDGLVPGAAIHAVLASHAAPAGSLKAGETTPAAETRDAVSDSAGHFELRGLTPGNWTLDVAAPGFRKFEARKLVLKPGDRHEVEGVVLVVAEQTADVTVTMTVEQVAEQEVHDEEHQRTLAIFPNYNTSYVWNAAPMTAKQKFKLSFHSTLDPISFATAAGVAGYQYGTNKYPEYGTGFSGFAEYYGAAWGTTFLGHTIGYAILPSLFHQDPRYFYMGTGTKKERAVHAIASSVLCRGNSGHTEFNASHIVGNFLAGYLSKTYHPGSNDGIGLAVDNTLIGVVGQMGVNLVREFAVKRISRGTPEYGKGKPEGEKVALGHP
jgi:hypothetical protein